MAEKESYMAFLQRKKDEYFDHCLRLCQVIDGMTWRLDRKNYTEQNLARLLAQIPTD